MLRLYYSETHWEAPFSPLFWAYILGATVVRITLGWVIDRLFTL